MIQMKNALSCTKSSAEKLASNTLGTVVTKAKEIGFVVTGTVLAFGASATPDSAAVNTQASGINAFIEGLLNGDIGYLLTLVAFFSGLGVAIFKREWMPAFYGFGIAVLILLVPDAMKGLFTLTTTS
jgi:hypothetical protein